MSNAASRSSNRSTNRSAERSSARAGSLEVLSGGRVLRRRMLRSAFAGFAVTAIAGLFTLGHMHGVVLESHTEVDTNRGRVAELQRSIHSLEVTVADMAGPDEIFDRARGELGMVEVTELVLLVPAGPQAVDDGVTRLLLTPVRVGPSLIADGETAEGEAAEGELEDIDAVDGAAEVVQ